jgi:hypothetical protein
LPKFLDEIISGKEVSRRKKGELMEQNKKQFMEIQAVKVAIERNKMAMVAKKLRIDV